MRDTDEHRLKAEIDEIAERIDTILKKIDELGPPSQENQTPPENSET